MLSFGVKPTAIDTAALSMGDSILLSSFPNRLGKQETSKVELCSLRAIRAVSQFMIYTVLLEDGEIWRLTVLHLFDR
jgi:hypothetical protein